MESIREKAVQISVDLDTIDDYANNYEGSIQAMGEGTKKLNALARKIAGYFGSSPFCGCYFVFGSNGNRMEVLKDILNGVELGDKSAVGFITMDGRETLSTQGDELKNGSKSLFTGLFCYQEAVSSEQTSGTVKDVEYQGESYCFIYSKIGNTGAVLCGMVSTVLIVKETKSIKTVTMAIIIVAVLEEAIGRLNLTDRNT